MEAESHPFQQSSARAAQGVVFSSAGYKLRRPFLPPLVLPSTSFSTTYFLDKLADYGARQEHLHQRPRHGHRCHLRHRRTLRFPSPTTYTPASGARILTAHLLSRNSSLLEAQLRLLDASQAHHGRHLSTVSSILEPALRLALLCGSKLTTTFHFISTAFFLTAHFTQEDV